MFRVVKVKGLIIYFPVNEPLHKLLDVATSNFTGV